MLTHYKPLIQAQLIDFLESERALFKTHFWAADVIDRFMAFAPAGKVFRGSLLLATYEMLTNQPPTSLLPAAASVELMHSSLIIHDDIIDRDELRRGQPTFIKQYQTLAASRQYASSDHTGLSLALCAGDIGFFWGMKLINQLELPAAQKKQILDFFAHEYCVVGLGEMLDVHQTALPTAVTEAEILELYRYKTARYTFSLPMLLAALAAQVTPEVYQLLEKLSESLGILFQIKDDELGLFGSEAETGKLAISDVREGKKTLYYYFGLQLATPAVQSRLRQLFGKFDLTVAELDEVKNAVITSGAKERVDTQILKLEKETKILIAQLPVKPEYQVGLSQFVDQNVLRKN